MDTETKKPRSQAPKPVERSAAPAPVESFDPFFVGFTAGRNLVENRSNQPRAFYFNAINDGDPKPCFGVGPSDDRDVPNAKLPTERSVDDAGLALLRLHPVFKTCEADGTIRVREG